MANAITVQKIQDGVSKVVVKIDGVLDTSEMAATTLLDPALLSAVDNNGTLATRLCIDKIIYDVEDALSINLSWDATTPVLIWHLVGRGKIEVEKMGSLQNNAGAGVNGKITAVSQGWAAGSILSFSIILECTKQYVPQI